MAPEVEIRDATRAEWDALGDLTVDAYLALEGMPPRDAMPGYYDELGDVATRAAVSTNRILIACGADGTLLGGVTFLLDLAHYGAPMPKDVVDGAGIRMLAVAPAAQGLGVGRALTVECLARARAASKRRVVLHTTQVMPVARRLYEKLGFRRLPEADFPVPLPAAAARGAVVEGYLLDL